MSGGVARHGHATRGSRSPTHITWASMKMRCQDSAQGTYKNYGARGVRVCERWQSFDNFLADMGARPEGHTLDRIDPNGNYEPSNCRWLTRAEQNRNRRNTKLSWSLVDEIRGRHDHGESKRAIAARIGVSISLIQYVVANSVWPQEERPL